MTDLSGKKLGKIRWNKLTNALPTGGVVVMHLRGKSDPLVVRRDRDFEQHKRRNKNETVFKVLVYGKGEYTQPDNAASTA